MKITSLDQKTTNELQVLAKKAKIFGWHKMRKNELIEALNTLTSDSAIDLYCVDLTDKEIPKSEEVEETIDKLQFKMIDSSYVITSDDTLLLASFTRLWNYFYVNSLKNQ